MKIFDGQMQLLTKHFFNWLTPENIEEVLVKLVLGAAVIAGTYLVIKVVSLIIDRILGDRDAGGEEETGRSSLSSNVIQPLRVLLKLLLVYGSYFLAIIIILEIFNVKIITPGDLKHIGTNILKVIGVIAGAKLIVTFGQRAIVQIFDRRDIKDNLLESGRVNTLKVLLQNVLTYVVFFMAGITVLQIFNVNTAAILASAGILGLAVGFGAQSLVRDIISGFFILFEDQFKVGDFVETAGVVGVVEEVGLRTCKIRQWTGQLHIIPNGEITRITNYSRGRMMAVVIIGIAYEEDVDQAMEVLRAASEVAAREIETIVEVPVVQGIVDLADSAVNIRIAATTVAGEQWAVERELRRRFKYALDRADIEIPYPRRVLYQRAAEMEEEPDKAGLPSG